MQDRDRLITLRDLREFKEEIILEIRKKNSLTDRKKWLKTKDVRKLLGLSGGTLQSMRNKNEITFSRVGRNIYYLESDVHTMLENRSNKNVEGR